MFKDEPPSMGTFITVAVVVMLFFVFLGYRLGAYLTS